LDDSTDDTREITADCAAELRERGFDVELIHRTDRTGFKAGALERGLATARGEFVCILDAILFHRRICSARQSISLLIRKWG
jgi:cellulose synthase/poly-beta-1,6-N-acetylglucosamine synthase-like glycosyltransferase